jgi:hypothetical protein
VAFERGEVSSVAGSLLLGEAGETAAAGPQGPPSLTTASSSRGPIKDSEEDHGGRVHDGRGEPVAQGEQASPDELRGWCRTSRRR